MKPDEFKRAIRSIRRKRWFLGGLILIYLPVIWASLQITNSDRDTGFVFAVWIGFLTIAVFIAAYARCPACGNYFHMKGFVPVWFGRCVHCGQTLKKGKTGPTAG